MASNIILTEPGTQNDHTIKLPKNYFYLLLSLLLVLFLYIIFREFDIQTQLQTADFYQNHIKSYSLDESWVMTKEQLRREQKIIDRMLIDRGNHKITREELGRQSWGIMHMITTTVPETLSPQLRQQFNAFLILFAKFYPCKLCANYFMKTLRKLGEFQGESRLELMDYMCLLHNKVNKRLKKKIYDCDLVAADWATCGCLSNNPINSILH